MTDREPVSGTDDAWRRIGTPENLTTITGVLWLDGAIGYDELCDRLEARLCRFDRFRQRVGGRGRTLRRPYWEPAEPFDVETHVQHVALPAPADTAALQRFVGGLMSRPLDERRPLWEAYLADGAGADDESAVAFRINHSIGDGFALLYVMLGLVDDPEAMELPMGIVPEPPGPDEFRESRAGGGEAATTDAADADPETDDSGLSLGGGGPNIGLAATALRAGWDLLTQADEPATSLRGELGAAKRAGWTEPVGLETVKTVGRAHDATVNDVLLGALAGAFRRVLAGRDETVPDRLRVTVPVNLRPMAARDGSLGNHFGLAFVPLPVGEPALGDRIRAVSDHMSAERAGVEAFLMYLALTAGGRSPDAVLEWLLRRFENRATGVVTNVPGPTAPVEFAGREITDIMFWVPQAVDQGLGISIFSYDGDVRLGIAADANLLDDPTEFADAFRAEMDALAEDADADLASE